MHLENWIKFSCACIAVVFNIFLIYLIILKSPKNIGFYKYLMICIAFAEILYACCEYVSDMTIFSYGHSYLVCRFITDTVLSRTMNYAINVVYCGFYGFFISIFASHFIYRYMVVHRSSFQRFLESKFVAIFFIVPCSYGCWWMYICVYWLHSTPETDDYYRDAVNQTFNLNIEDFTYIVILYYREDAEGNLHPKYDIFFAMFMLWFMIVSSLGCVAYFGYKCFAVVFKALQNQNTANGSVSGKSVQKQLFQALVVQALIPLLLMYIPCGVIFTLPMLFRLNFTATYLTTTFMIYPAIDPLPNFFIIGTFRSSIKEILSNFFDWLTCKHLISHRTVSVVSTTGCQTETQS